jgi:uncharacterized membrane protein YeaQ/YmgE (transglycosylase-associated protein family)
MTKLIAGILAAIFGANCAAWLLYSLRCFVQGPREELFTASLIAAIWAAPTGAVLLVLVILAVAKAFDIEIRGAQRKTR